MAKRQQRAKKEEEPIGIIITRERTSEPEPRFAAYVYGIVEESEKEPAGVAA